MPTLEESLRGRWPESYDKNPRLSPVKKHLEASLSSISMLATKRAELAKDANLSPVGRATQMKDFGAKEVVPTIARATNAIAAYERHLDSRRKALLPSVKDPTNVAAALLRSEFRAHIASKPTMLFEKDVDPRLLEAAAEVPPTMIGLTADQYGKVMDMYVERTHGTNAAAITQEAEALNLTRVVVKVAADALRKEVMPSVADPKVFHEWVSEAATAAGIKSDDGDAEIAALSVAAIKEDAKKLTLADRVGLVDALLAQNHAEVAA